MALKAATTPERHGELDVLTDSEKEEVLDWLEQHHDILPNWLLRMQSELLDELGYETDPYELALRPVD